MKQIIENKLNIIKNNLFTNDLNWNNRAIQNSSISKEIREIITTIKCETIEDRRLIVETLDFLENHNL